MKSLLEKLSASAFNWLFYILKNRESLDFNREEIRYARTSFSQFGEDTSILRWTQENEIFKGCYLDIGAFHPIHLSNTLLLYKSGWRGVNIDMNPEKIEKFNIFRSEDDNICCAVSDKPRQYVVENKGKPTERLRILGTGESFGDKYPIIESKTLQQCLKGTRLEAAHIDYINIDCEGHDFEVLKQIDFQVQSPTLITIEALTMTEQDRICDYLVQRGYCLSEKMHWTLFFTKADKLHNQTYIRQSSIHKSVTH